MTAINKITAEDVERFMDDPSLDQYQHIALKSAIYPGKGTALGLMYVSLKGCGEAGEFAEHVGKAMRDDEFARGLHVHLDGSVSRELTAMHRDRREKLIKEVGDQLWYLAAKCHELGITLGYAAGVNLEKLCDRADRGVLQGSGDDR